jgi:hypothetical protein
MMKAIRSLICWLPLLTLICMNPASGEAASLSEDLYSFQVLIGGESIALPCTYDRMKQAGWTYTGNEEELLKPEQRTVSSAWEKNGVLLSAQMVNTSWDVLPVDQCVLAAVQLDASASQVQLPGGVLLGVSGLREVMDAYGAPSALYEDGEISRITYQLDYDQEAVFTFDASTGVMQSASLRNVVMAAAPDPTDLLGSSASGSSSYRTPSSLGDDPFSFHVSYSDALYTLPAPVKEFEKNGWVLGEGADDVVKAYGSGQLTLSRNGKQWTTWVYNDSDNATLAGSCLITTVVSDMGRGDVTLVLPGGITPGMAEEEMLNAYSGIDAKISETDASRRYEFNRGGGDIILSVQLDTGLISRVEVKNEP